MKGNRLTSKGGCAGVEDRKEGAYKGGCSPVCGLTYSTHQKARHGGAFNLQGPHELWVEKQNAQETLRVRQMPFVEEWQWRTSVLQTQSPSEEEGCFLLAPLQGSGSFRSLSYWFFSWYTWCFYRHILMLLSISKNHFSEIEFCAPHPPISVYCCLGCFCSFKVEFFGSRWFVVFPVSRTHTEISFSSSLFISATYLLTYPNAGTL